MVSRPWARCLTLTRYSHRVDAGPAAQLQLHQVKDLGGWSGVFARGVRLWAERGTTWTCGHASLEVSLNLDLLCCGVSWIYACIPWICAACMHGQRSKLPAAPEQHSEQVFDLEKSVAHVH